MEADQRWAVTMRSEMVMRLPVHASEVGKAMGVLRQEHGQEADIWTTATDEHLIVYVETGTTYHPERPDVIEKPRTAGRTGPTLAEVPTRPGPP